MLYVDQLQRVHLLVDRGVCTVYGAKRRTHLDSSILGA